MKVAAGARREDLGDKSLMGSRWFGAWSSKNGEGDLEKFGRCHGCRDTLEEKSSSLEAGHDRKQLVVERHVVDKL